MRLRLSPFLVKTDPDSDIILNSRTGQRTEISQEALKLLTLFKESKSFDEALRFIDASSKEKKKILTFLQKLRDERILIPEKELFQDRDFHVSVNDVLVESPSRTFFSCPAKELSSLNGEDIAFVGIPFDLGTTGYPGARFGPDKIRELSSDSFNYHVDIFTGKCKGWLSLDKECAILEGIRMVDIGNVILQVGENFETFYDRITKAVRILSNRKIFPAIVGGDHSCTYAILRAIKDEYDSLSVVHIDAHTDLGDLFPGVSNNHGNVFTRVRNEGLISHLYQFGVRGVIGKELQAENYSLFSLAEIREKSMEGTVTLLNQGKYYLSLDIDVLDPIFAPGTGTPLSAGMTPEMLFELLSLICRQVEIVGCDLVEVNPMLDVNNQTSQLAVSILLQILSEVFR